MPKMVLSCRETELIREVGEPVPVSWAAGLGIDAARCRVKVREKPRPWCRYAAGADFGYGIMGRDLDACYIFDKTAQIETGRVREVACIKSRLGEQFILALYPLLCWYNDAFLVGERQVGLPTLRRLWDTYGFDPACTQGFTRARRILCGQAFALTWEGPNPATRPEECPMWRFGQPLLRPPALCNGVSSETLIRDLAQRDRMTWLWGRINDQRLPADIPGW